jgi:HAD superfamily hydrolase (TIGR01509 family)
MADFETILGRAGVRATAVALDRAYEQSGSYLGRVWAKNADVTGMDHVRAILAALDAALPAQMSGETMAALLDAYAAPALLVPPMADTTARAALERLRAQGVALAIVSNTMRTPGATLRKILDRVGLLACFAHTTFSDEVGVRKPAPEIFALTLRALGVEPAAAVHVGDDPILDVGGARAAGLRAIHVTNTPLRSMSPLRPDAVIPNFATLPDVVARLDAI